MARVSFFSGMAAYRLFAVIHGVNALGLASEPLTLPGPGLEVPVDVDGDGRDTFGDRYFFNWWLGEGGALGLALSEATTDGKILDLSAFFQSSAAQLPAAKEGVPPAAAPDAELCPQPEGEEFPNHTRRIPPGLEPLGRSQDARMTPDGRYMVFSSKASNLPGANGKYQVYRFEQGASSTGGLIVHVSLTQHGLSSPEDCLMPSISNDGTRVVFQTRARLSDLENTEDEFLDIYLVDLEDPDVPALTWVSLQAYSGNRGDSFGACISGSGRFVAFTSAADDLVADDQNGRVLDVFRHDLEAGENDEVNEIASVDNRDVPRQSVNPFSTIGDDPVLCPAQEVGDLRVGRVISDDGARVVMHARPCDWAYADGDFFLCPDVWGHCDEAQNRCLDLTSSQQVYLHDFSRAQRDRRTFLVSERIYWADGACDGMLPGDGCSRRGSISRDGSRVAFSSFSQMFRDDNDKDSDFWEDVFFVDVGPMLDGTRCPQRLRPWRVSVWACGLDTGGDSFQPVLSEDGSRIAFASDGNQLLQTPCPETNGRRDVFIREVVDREQGTTRRFSVDSAGVAGNGDSMNPDTSGDGRIALYQSLATNLLGPQGDRNGAQDVFQSPSPQGPFIRGDVDLNGTVNLSDGVKITNWLFLGSPPPPCYDAADANDDGRIEIADTQRICLYLFEGGPPPPCPFCCSPSASCCGKDRTGDGLPCGVTLEACVPFSAEGTCP